MVFFIGQTMRQRSRREESHAWQSSGSAVENASRPTPQAAEVIFLKGEVLPIPTLLPLRKMHRAGARASVAPKAGAKR
ncbi:MAG: hypothetical protein DRJ61_05875 [Acidobacteria bacterium]|nr:MAG: hypothetical protein DRJ65_11385 [Acidobacteriota bacterium]RLE34094.1 MAG: hypothetical protein DRJ61_05875 [Acidobacteriota bacterium]